MKDPYWRRARATRVIDGDTVDVVIDLGFYINAAHRLRLLGLDTPELHDRDPEMRARAEAAKSYTADWLDEHVAHASEADWPYSVRTEKSDVFGRFLAYVECGQEHSLNDALLESGHAVVWQR